MALGGPSTAFKLNWPKARYSGKRVQLDGIRSHATSRMNVYAKFDHHENSFRVTPFVKDSLSVGSETIDVTILQDRFLTKDLNLKTQYASDIRSDVEKCYVVPASYHDSKKPFRPRMVRTAPPSFKSEQTRQNSARFKRCF